jgi:hypothetical protein
MSVINFNELRARDDRWWRAIQDVRKRYTLTRHPPKKEQIPFTVTGGTNPYTVTVSSTWSQLPKCSCPDGKRLAKTYLPATHSRVFCKHLVATLLDNPDIRYQLIDNLL